MVAARPQNQVQKQAAEIKAQNRKINALQHEVAVRTKKAAAPKRAQGPPRRNPGQQPRGPDGRLSKKQMTVAAKRRSANVLTHHGGNKNMFDAFAQLALKAIPTSQSSGSSVCQKFRYCAMKYMGPLTARTMGTTAAGTAINTGSYQGGRNALIFHPFNNVACFHTDDSGLSTLNPKGPEGHIMPSATVPVGSAGTGGNKCPIGHYGLFERISDSVPVNKENKTAPTQIAALDKNIPKEVQVQRLSIRIRNITTLRDLDGGVYILRVPHLSAMYKTWREKGSWTRFIPTAGTPDGGSHIPDEAANAFGMFNAIAYGESHDTGYGQDINAAGKYENHNSVGNLESEEAFLKKFVKTHNQTRFYTAAQLVATKQINIHVRDAMMYETWHTLCNAVPAHRAQQKEQDFDTMETDTRVMGNALSAVSTSLGGALGNIQVSNLASGAASLGAEAGHTMIDVADDMSTTMPQAPHKWHDGGWMASATSSQPKMHDLPAGVAYLPSGMGAVIMLFESRRLQEYEVTCAMTMKARYSAGNILSQMHSQQPTAPLPTINAMRDIEEAKGSSMANVVNEGAAAVERVAPVLALG